MYPISEQLSEALRYSYSSACTVQVWYDGHLVDTLPVVDGSVSIDRTASIRRQCTITIGDPSFVPLYADSPIAPYGAELKIFVGVRFMDGSDEQVPLGVFRIQDVDWSEDQGSLPTVKAFDRSKAIDDAKLLMPYDASGRSGKAVLTYLVSSVIDADVLISDTLRDYTLPGGSVFDSDRWSAVQSIANGMGADVYFDVYGNCIVTPIPEITNNTEESSAVWVIDHGATGVLVSAQRTVSRTGVYNAVAAQGVSSNGEGSPPIGFAADTDVRSPTYWGPASALPYGPYEKTPFGQSVYRYTNNLLTTTQHCNTAARGQLANFLGLAKGLSFSCVPNPALDAGDIILVTYPSGGQELHLIDKLDIPLGAGGDFGGSTRSTIYQLPAE